MRQKTGRVYLVGAGPGDPGLITLKGVDRLRQADLVLYDDLVHPAILKHAPPRAELVCLVHIPHKRGLNQEDINARLVAAALQGKIVVRLKGGDPESFDRSADETEALDRAGISWQAVPGVTAAMAAASLAARPLFGVRILVTRPGEQAEALAELFSDLGAEVRYQPAIEISEPADWGPVDHALQRLDQYQWLVFSSSNGVCFLLNRLEEKHGDLRKLGNIRLAAIGPGTAAELRRYRLCADVVPDPYRAEALAEALAPGARGWRFLLARASRGREVLAEKLVAAGALVEQVVVYRSIDVEKAEPEVASALAAGRIDWITVTSSVIARSLARLFGEDLRRAKLASISPITSEAIRRLGFEPAVEAAEYTMEGLVRAIAQGARGL